MKKITTLLFLFCVSTYALMAQKYSNEFLNIGVGAKGQALGGAVAAMSNDVTAAYWNPAALANMSHNQGLQVSAMHTDWFAGISNYDYLGIALPSSNNRRTVAVSVIRFGIDKIPNTLSLYNSDGTINYNNIREFSAADYAFLGSYATHRNLGEAKLSFGTNAKVVRRVIGSFANSWGFGLDLGAQYVKGGFNAGLVAKDITQTFNSWRFSFTEKEKQVLQLTNNEVPISELEKTKPTIVAAAGYKKAFGKVGVSAEIDANITTDGNRNTLISGNTISVNPAAGVELSYDQLIYLRGGISNLQQDNNFDQKKFWIAQPSFGVGIKVRGIQVDYAYSNIGSSEARFYSNAVSLILSLKPKGSTSAPN